MRRLNPTLGSARRCVSCSHWVSCTLVTLVPFPGANSVCSSHCSAPWGLCCVLVLAQPTNPFKCFCKHLSVGHPASACSSSFTQRVVLGSCALRPSSLCIALVLGVRPGTVTFNFYPAKLHADFVQVEAVLSSRPCYIAQHIKCCDKCGAANMPGCH